MTTDLRRGARFLVIPTIALVAIVVFFPGRVTLAVRIYALLVCGVLLAIALAALLRAYPAATRLRPAAGRADRGHGQPQSLARLEQEAAIGVAGAFDLHYRLRPKLRDLAIDLLATRRRISLDASTEEARAVLGDETWELVRQDRLPPEDRLARGLGAPALQRVVESLERV